MATELYDSTLLGILQNEGQISKFLETVMGFLYRRTDFYHVMKSQDEKLGFPPGVAARMLIQAYEKYEALARHRDLSQDTRIIIPSRPDQNDIALKTTAEIHQEKPVQASEINSNNKKSEAASKSNPDQELKPEDSQKAFQRNPESHNGAIRDGFRWAQTLTDCDLRIQVPSHITTAKQVQVAMKKKHIFVSCLDETSKKHVLIDSDLEWDINLEESMWSLVPGYCVHINLEKVKERWWENVFVGEAKISTQKIEASVPMEQLDDDAQSTVSKLMYDQHQKSLGLPTSQEQSLQEKLKKAWNAKGSPFKGTPYDPSVVNISGQNT